MNLRKATIEDICIIQDLADKSWRSAYSKILSLEQINYMLETMYNKNEIYSHFNNNWKYFLLIDNENNHIGFMGYQLDYELNTTKLHRIYILSEFSGKGFGKFAINFLKNDVYKYGNNRIILNVNKNNPAIHFYKSQGFKVYDSNIFDIGNGFVMDDYLMDLYI